MRVATFFFSFLSLAGETILLEWEVAAFLDIYMYLFVPN